jgi:hypothetical protein
MTNINLASKETEKAPSSLEREWTICVVVIIFLLLTYIGLIAYNSFLAKKTDALNREYESRNSALMESGKNVFDFQNRLTAAGPLVLGKNYALESLDQIGKIIIPGVYVESFTWDSDEGKFSLECIAVDYRLVANQVASFKKSDYFSEVVVNKTSNREDGKIKFFIELSLENKK